MQIELREFLMHRGLVILVLLKLDVFDLSHATKSPAGWALRIPSLGSSAVSIDPHQMLHVTNLLKSQNSTTRLSPQLFFKYSQTVRHHHDRLRKDTRFVRAPCGT